MIRLLLIDNRYKLLPPPFFDFAKMSYWIILRQKSIVMKYVLSVLSLLAVLLSACSGEQHDHHFSHGEGELHGYLLPGLDHGLMQSPINMLSTVSKPGHHSLKMEFSGAINMVENKGHTVQLDFLPGSTVTVDGRTYDMIQCHFHTPSEHLVDGMTFPMEMHVVNRLQGQEEGDVPSYLVIGYLYKMGESSDFLERFIGLIPAEAGTTKEVNWTTLFGERSPEDVLEDWTHYYHYRGSLTTPPYTESVEWYVLSRIHEASPEQIMRINAIEGDNARHIQGIYGREIDQE